MAGFVDIACNFTHESFKDNLETVIADAEDMGVEKFVLLCASLNDLAAIQVIQNKGYFLYQSTPKSRQVYISIYLGKPQ